jgi:hypothetical protein
MDHDEAMAWFLTPIKISRWVRLKFNLKLKYNHYRAMKQLQSEIDNEDPKGGADEVLRLRQVTTLEPEYITQT